MFFALSKILLFAIAPLTWIVLLMLFALFHKNEKKKKRYLVTSILLLIFFSNTFIFDRFMNAWEVPAIPDSKLPQADASILLTGMTTYDIHNDRLEFNDRTDRLMQVIKLYRQKKISKIFLSGGAGTMVTADTINTIKLRDYLITLGVYSSDLITENKSNNTHENALRIKPLLKSNFPNGNFLLVTSGWHLRRATACFRKEGIRVIPYSTDRYSGPVKLDIDYLLLPSSSTLFNWEKLTHEWVGCIVYSMRGYI
jgi:uncharacterized SAM-binding protein YcdF (DUF218 family)